MNSITKRVSEYKYYNVISIAFVVCLVVSNIAAVKLCDFLGYATLDAGTMTFPLLYILNDVITEVYGFSASRRTIYIALFSNCFVAGFLWLVALMPPAKGWDNQEAFVQVFSLSPRIVVASISSYFIGELANSTIIASLKIKLEGKMFVYRAILSTTIGSLIESAIFSCLAFYAIIPAEEILKMIGLLTAIKIAYEIVIMPITVRCVDFLKKTEKADVYEKPFTVGFSIINSLKS